MTRITGMLIVAGALAVGCFPPASSVHSAFVPRCAYAGYSCAMHWNFCAFECNGANGLPGRDDSCHSYGSIRSAAWRRCADVVGVTYREAACWDWRNGRCGEPWQECTTFTEAEACDHDR